MVSGMPEYWCQPEWKEVDGITQEYIYNFIKTLEDYKPVSEQFQLYRTWSSDRKSIRH